MKERLLLAALLAGVAWRRARRTAPISLRDRVVILTGASSGIGRAAAHAFAAEGARLVLAARRPAPLAAVQQELAVYGVPTLALPADISRDDDLRALVAEALRAFRCVDVLVNNAAVDLGGLLQEHDPARLRAVLEVNLYGAIRLTQMVLPVMLRQGGGHVVNVGSLAGRIPTPGQAAYGAVKAGLAAFSDALRREVDDHGLRVTLVLPALTRTPMIAAADPAPLAAVGWHPQEPQVVAAAIVAAVRHGRREVVLGGLPAQVGLWVERLAPRLMDLYWRWAVTPAYLHAVSRFGVRQPPPA